MKINLGCGNRKLSGYLGVDKFRTDAVDRVADLNGTLPFEKDEVEEVIMDNVIEHISDVSMLMSEIYRICKNGAKVRIITPHFSSLASWRDPAHFHHLSYFSMDHFEKPETAHYTGGGFRVVKRSLSFGGGVMGLMGRLLFSLSPERYEKKWCFLFRASTLSFELKIVK